MTAHDDLVARLTQAIAESNEALTAVSQAHEHAEIAATTFEQTTKGTNLTEVTQATAEARAAVGAALRLAATMSTAINDLQSYLDRETGGGTSPALAPSLPPTGEELLESGPVVRGVVGRVLDAVSKSADDLQEKSSQAAHFVQISKAMKGAGLRPPTTAHTGTVVATAEEPIAPPAQAADPGDLVGSGVVILVAVAKGVDHMLKKRKNRKGPANEY